MDTFTVDYLKVFLKISFYNSMPISLKKQLNPNVKCCMRRERR
jgi:hypothetical protein